MKPKRLYFALPLILIFSTLGLFGQDALEWVGGFSSSELSLTDETENQDTVYYLWQLESLKKNISPRYIRYLDVESYLETNRLLKRGILFSYNGLRDESVEICGNFSHWECLPMKRNKYGIYYLVVEPNLIAPDYQDDPVYEYKFRVNGLLTFDSENIDKVEDGSGSFLSRFILERKDTNRQITTTVLEDSNSEEIDLRTVRFQMYLPNAEVVSLVGNFNDWNPEHDFLKKERNGIFYLEKKLLPGEYHYQFIVDGDFQIDTYNPTTNVKVDTNESVSSIVVPTRELALEKKD
ncbi:glycogen-binding domain-containing protein [Leptospira idonii]|uniref:Carbohydrate-binding module 48 n=1 Tax=Leptospira idonii TaxID=1193500 RepID=A0A4R9LZS7_9LEPT|nr:glycogen-binding domain-containing protein [Leptospira idonii]TGN18877.1 carbohydrate-binding module 48 [Leptospira idonii]